MAGSKLIQNRLQAMLDQSKFMNDNNNYNNNHNNSDNRMHVFNANFNNGYYNNFDNVIVNQTKCVIFEFFNEISSFGHLLCIDKYGHHAIEKLLTVCYGLDIINVLEHFMKYIIIQNFSMLMQHSYPCRIVQDMLGSHSNRLKIYVLTQLNCFFNTQQTIVIRSENVTPFGDSDEKNEVKTQNFQNGGTDNVSAVQSDTHRAERDRAVLQSGLKSALQSGSRAGSGPGPETSTLTTKARAALGNIQMQGQAVSVPGCQDDNKCGDAGKSGIYKCQILYDTITHHIGNYIIQAMIETACQLNIGDGMLSYLLEFVSNYGALLACNRFGCRVVQCCIVSQNISYVNKCPLFVSLFHSLADLCNHQYGNYSVQKCIEYGGYDIRKLFIEEIFFGINLKTPNFSNSTLFNARYTLPNALRASFENYISNVQNKNTIINFSKFSFGKYSSIVCDAAFKYAADDQRESLVVYLSNPNISIKYNVLFGLVNHEYGNFVIKNMINTLINVHENVIRGATNPNGTCTQQQRANKYAAWLQNLKQTLDNIFALVSKYHCHTKFSFAHNVIQVANVNNM